MNEVTRILSAIQQGDPHAAAQLLPLIYDELRKLATQHLSREKPGQTLQATALVHEAYVRLVDVEQAQQWNSRGHFFAAAAEAMRRILVDAARAKRAQKRGGGRARQPLDEAAIVVPAPVQDILGLDAALDRLAAGTARRRNWSSSASSPGSPPSRPPWPSVFPPARPTASGVMLEPFC